MPRRRGRRVRAVTALSRDGNVSLPEVFVGNVTLGGVIMGWSCRWAGRASANGERAVHGNFTSVDEFPSATPARIRSAWPRSRGSRASATIFA